MIPPFLEQRNLFTKKDYYYLLKPVVEVFGKSKDVEEMRRNLFEQSNLEKCIQVLIEKKQLTPGIVLSYGTKNYQETIVSGNRREVTFDNNQNILSDIRPMKQDTVFDLASVTKIFTSLSILKLVEMNLIHLEDKIIEYTPQFINLKDVTIYDLISFKIPLETTSRIENASSKEEAENILFNIKIKQEEYTERPYTDMGAMILKYVIEAVSGLNYYDFLKKYFLNPFDMNHTTVKILNSDNVANTNLAGEYKKGILSIQYTSPGIVYDKKARILGQPEGILSGHAGLFSNVPDMTTLARNMISGKFLPEEFIEMLSKNRTGEKYTKESKELYRQYLGFLCYSKNPILGDSEVYHPLSGKAFASSGWTGTQLTIDSINHIHLFLGSSKSHNRIPIADSSTLF